MKSAFLRSAICCAAMVALPAAHAVGPGEVDTFSSGVEGWFAGGGPVGGVPPAPPTVIADGGPAGAGDSFLLLRANGSDGPGGRLVGMNASQWAGDYIGAGITAIAMDLRNLARTELSIRLYFEDPIAAPPLDEAVTTMSVVLPVGAGWTHVVFPISPAALTVLQGSATTLLANTTVLRIFSGDAPDFPPDRVAGVLGVDNIQAIAVPEPATLALLVAGLGAIGWRTRRSAQRR